MKRKVVTMADILTSDDIKGTVDKFINQHMAKANDLVMVWREGDTVFVDPAGLSEVEAMGLLEFAKLYLFNSINGGE